jgi:hypothetical protein
VAAICSEDSDECKNIDEIDLLLENIYFTMFIVEEMVEFSDDFEDRPI